MDQQTVKEYLVGHVQDIPERGSVLVQAGELEVGVFKIRGRLHAYENRCCHAGGPVCEGEVVGRYEEIIAPDKTKIGDRLSEQEIHIACPWHGYEYNLETGECYADRRLHLRKVELAVRNGQVYVVA